MSAKSFISWTLTCEGILIFKTNLMEKQKSVYRRTDKTAVEAATKYVTHMVTSLTISTMASPFLVLISEMSAGWSNNQESGPWKYQLWFNTFVALRKWYSTFVALIKWFIQKPVRYLLNVLGQWVSGAEVNLFLCNFLWLFLCNFLWRHMRWLPNQ